MEAFTHILFQYQTAIQGPMVTRARQMTLLFNITQRTFYSDSNCMGGGGQSI